MSHRQLFYRHGLAGRRPGVAAVNTNTLGLGAHYDNQPTGPAYASTPNQGGFLPGSQTIDLRVKIALASWLPSGNQFVLAKWGAAAADSQYSMYVDNAGKLNGAWYRPGGVFTGGASTAATGFAANAAAWIRTLLAPAAGTIDYYTSTDGATWTALGTQRTGLATGAVQIPGTPQPLTVGATAGATGTAIGKIFAAHLLIGGNTVAAVDFSTQAPGAASFLGVTGEMWTLSGSASIV